MQDAPKRTEEGFTSRLRYELGTKCNRFLAIELVFPPSFKPVAQWEALEVQDAPKRTEEEFHYRSRYELGTECNRFLAIKFLYEELFCPSNRVLTPPHAAYLGRSDEMHRFDTFTEENLFLD